MWSMVTATVHPPAGKNTPIPAKPQTLDTPARVAPIRPLAKPKVVRDGVKVIEPRRKHRIARERDPIGARLDLHGLDQERARRALEAFLRRAWDEGVRAVLVITGKGVMGDGVLRRKAPEWLATPYLASIVAGLSEAHGRHGGKGALYVALKRKARY